jgi:hypothetical protein
MKQSLVMITVIYLIILWGCTQKTSVAPEAAPSDEQAIFYLIDENAEIGDIFYDDLDELSEDNFMDMTPPQMQIGLFKPITPWRFGRINKRPIDRSVTLEQTSDSTITAYFHKVMAGRFHIIVKDRQHHDTLQVIRVVKSMHHEFQRVAHFLKIGEEGGEGERLRHRWQLQEFSMVLGNSLGRGADSTIVKTSLQITKVIIADTLEITDPLDFFQNRGNMLTFPPETQITITVYVKNSADTTVIYPRNTQSTELVRLHHARHRRYPNQRMHGISNFTWVEQDAEGNNIYQGTWITGTREGIHHAVIDIIDNGTIMNDDEIVFPYNSTTWSTPYHISTQ